MKRDARLLPLVVVAAAFAAVLPSASCAADYPSRPIRLLVAYPPGGGSDTLARVIAPRLAQLLGQQIVVDNRSGAAGNIATEITARAQPDGYTLLWGFSTPLVVNPSLWYGLIAPAATPANIVNRLNAECLKVLAIPDVREALKREGLEPSGGTPQEFARYIRDEKALWAKVIADAGIKPE